MRWFLLVATVFSCLAFTPEQTEAGVRRTHVHVRAAGVNVNVNSRRHHRRF